MIDLADDFISLRGRFTNAGENVIGWTDGG
jgi:hypothetical protein